MPYTPVQVSPSNNSNHPVTADVINGLGQLIADLSLQILNVQPLFQSIPYAATITPNAYLGATVKVGTLTGNLTINAPIDALPGFTLTFILTQDGTGGRTVAFNAVYTGPKTVASAASATTVLAFVYDGTNWN